jgi:hypothetical protein
LCSRFLRARPRIVAISRASPSDQGGHPVACGRRHSRARGCHDATNRATEHWVAGAADRARSSACTRHATGGGESFTAGLPILVVVAAALLLREVSALALLVALILGRSGHHRGVGSAPLATFTQPSSQGLQLSGGGRMADRADVVASVRTVACASGVSPWTAQVAVRRG